MIRTTGGIVLAGGRSERMGTDKAALDWHGSTLLRRVAGIVARAVDGPVVVVGAPEQELPAVAGVEVARDAREGRGPLEGLAAGLGVLWGRVDAAYVAATDAPFLHPAFVRRVVAALAGGADVALPFARGFPQPLAAAYRTGIEPLLRELLSAGRTRPAFLFEACEVARLEESDLLSDPAIAQHDPRLESLTNLNDPREYQVARDRPPPEIDVDGTGRVPAAVLGAAAAAAGADLARAVVHLNGARVPADPELPLVAGDRVAFGRRG